MSPRISDPRSLFRCLHAVWAVIGFCIGAVLVFARGGHPPLIVFLPIVVAVWAAGHMALLAAGFLARRGVLHAGSHGARWTPVLLLAVGGCGIATLIGLIQAIVTLLTREPYLFRGGLWATTMVIWLLHGACLCGLLLRRRWAGPFAGTLSLGWGALMAWQIVDHGWRGRPIDPMEMSIATTIVAATAAFGILLIRSREGRAGRR